MLVSDVMRKDVKTIRPDATIKEAAKLMVKYRIGSLVVLDGSGNIKGLVTERDVLTKISSEECELTDKVEGIMTKNIITISPEESIEEAARIMTKNKIKKLPVVEGDHLVGIITATDLVAYEKELVEEIADILVSPRQVTGISG